MLYPLIIICINMFFEKNSFNILQNFSTIELINTCFQFIFCKFVVIKTNFRRLYKLIL